MSHAKDQGCAVHPKFPSEHEVESFPIAYQKKKSTQHKAFLFKSASSPGLPLERKEREVREVVGTITQGLSIVAHSDKIYKGCF